MNLARNLLGQYIVHEQPEGTIVVRIVETEAYHGPEDQAAHSFENRRTKRTEVMFGTAGTRLYVSNAYTYTYECCRWTSRNTTCNTYPCWRTRDGIRNDAGKSRNDLKMKDWTNGPGKLSKALGVTMQYYGHHWTDKPLFIAEGAVPGEIMAGPWVGIGNSGEAVHYPWRFFEKDNPYVSNFDLKCGYCCKCINATGYNLIKIDMENVGSKYADKEVISHEK